MRKLVLPLVIMLALLATVSGAQYMARVDMTVDPIEGHTYDSELALSIPSNPIAQDFLSYVAGAGQGDVVLADFKTVQRSSEYFYKQVLYITNNKPYDVTLKVSSVDIVTDGSGASGQFTFQIMGQPPVYLISLDSDGTPSMQNTIAIPAGGTHTIGFRLTTTDTCEAQTVVFTVHFVAN